MRTRRLAGAPGLSGSARAEAGIEEIGRIASTADPDEQSAIRQMNESLYMLAGSLRGGR